MRLRYLLSLLLAGLLMVPVGTIGWLGYSSNRQQIKRGAEDEFALANGAAAGEITNFLNEPVNRLLDELSLRARRGMLNLKDEHLLGLDLVERLRVNPHLAWIDYSDEANGHFIGARRAENGDMVLNRSTPGPFPPSEIAIMADGREIPLKAPRSVNYDPRQRDWYKNAIAAASTVWSEPYAFMEGDIGITASRAWRPVDGAAPAGVFAVDFYLKDLQALLDQVSLKFHGVALVMEPDGTLLCASSHGNPAALTPALEKWVQAHAEFSKTNSQMENHLVPITVGETRYLAALEHIDEPSGLKCIVAGMVPESVIYRDVNRAGKRMEVVGISGMVIAILAGIFMAYRISEPLRVLGNDLAKVGEFYLAPQVVGRSVVSEVNQLRDVSERMKSGLRSFIKYMPDDVVRRLLSSGQEAVLGGETRHLTLFFSDIEGFTAHTEQVSSNVLVAELAAYFEVLSRRVRQHSGTIDKFIGDGLLAFFNAPEDVPNHENLACRAALIGQQELAFEAKEGRMATFRTRIGLHCGDVLVGNIGTPERFAYTVLGDAVNVASRLESLNKMYGTTILASGDVQQAAGMDFEWRHLDRVAVVGRKGSMDLFELMALKGGVDEDRLANRKLYEEALEFYFAGSFWDARRIFGQLAEQQPIDKAALLMMTRCEHMLGEDVPGKWDGVFVYNVK
jgi:adenylate cyclase